MTNTQKTFTIFAIALMIISPMVCESTKISNGETENITGIEQHCIGLIKANNVLSIHEGQLSFKITFMKAIQSSKTSPSSKLAKVIAELSSGQTKMLAQIADNEADVEKYDTEVKAQLTGDDLTSWNNQFSAANKDAAIKYQSAMLCNFSKINDNLAKMDSSKFAWFNTVQTDCNRMLALAEEGVTHAGGNTDAAYEFCNNLLPGNKGSTAPVADANADAKYEFSHTTEGLLGSTAPVKNNRLLAAKRLTILH